MMLLDSYNFRAKVSDFPEYYTAAWMVVHGEGSGLYDLGIFAARQFQLFPEMAERTVGFYLVPQAVLFVLPFCAVPKETGYIVWLVLSICALAGACYLLYRLLSLSPRFGLMLWSIVAVSGPAYEALRLGQISPILLLSYSASLSLIRGNRPLLAALTLLPLMAKPQLLIPACSILLGGKKYRLLAYLFVFFVVLTVVSFFLVGEQGCFNYFQHIQGNIIHKEHFTPTLRDQIRMITGSDNPWITQFSYIVYGLGLSLLYLISRHRRQATFDLLLLFAMPFALLYSPYAQVYDWVLIIPSVAFFYKSGFADRLPDQPVVLLFVLLSIYLMPFSVFIHYYYLNKGGVFNPFFLVGFYFFALVLWSYLKKESDGNLPLE